MNPDTYLTLNKAAELCGRSKGTITKAIKRGALSAVSKENGVFQIDPAEVLRVFPIKQASTGVSNQKETFKSNSQNDLETRIKMVELETKLEAEKKEKEIYKEQVVKLEKDRNDWKEQANKLLLPNPVTAQATAKKPMHESMIVSLVLIVCAIAVFIIYMTKVYWMS